MSFTERVRDGINEFLPFSPEIPIKELIPKISIFLEKELGDDVLSIRHFGSTADTLDNRLRVGYKPPHKGSDVDILAVVKDGLDTNQLRNDLLTKLKENPISKEAINLNIVGKSTYDNSGLEGHPALLLYAHAKEYGCEILFHKK